MIVKSFQMSIKTNKFSGINFNTLKLKVADGEKTTTYFQICVKSAQKLIKSHTQIQLTMYANSFNQSAPICPLNVFSPLFLLFFINQAFFFKFCIFHLSRHSLFETFFALTVFSYIMSL